MNLLGDLDEDGDCSWPTKDRSGRPAKISVGIGMDSCVIPLREYSSRGVPPLFLVQTTDFFYPIIDDPYVMGKIACANVLSDLYAMGVTLIDNMELLLGITRKMTERERDVVSQLLIEGFKDAAKEAGTNVKGGDTKYNSWCMIGGVATSVCTENEFIMPTNAVPGDVLVLTKPLGTQVACKAFASMGVHEIWNRIQLVITEDEMRNAHEIAIKNMSRLNKGAAVLMHEFSSHAATDVTGFGILGHAENLAKYQKKKVSFVIHNLPVINKMVTVSKACGNTFKLQQGRSPETSGGLLICLPREKAEAFCKEIEKREGHQAWIIGIVERGDNTARIIQKPFIINVGA